MSMMMTVATAAVNVVQCKLFLQLLIWLYFSRSLSFGLLLAFHRWCAMHQCWEIIIIMIIIMMNFRDEPIKQVRKDDKACLSQILNTESCYHFFFCILYSLNTTRPHTLSLNMCASCLPSHNRWLSSKSFTFLKLPSGGLHRNLRFCDMAAY